MGFFGNIKNKLGIGGVSVELQTPGQVAKDAKEVVGKLQLTTKSEQQVVSITVKMIEEFTQGRDEEKKTKEFKLGEIKINEAFDIKPGDTKEIPFTLPFGLIKSTNDQLKEKGGVLGVVGKLGAMAGNEKSEYFIHAVADVKAAALDPTDKKQIRIV